MKVLVTRPVEDGEETARQLALRGFSPVLAPLLTTQFWDGPEVSLDGVQAILATSANGVRAFSRRSARRDIPLFAVGPQTAEQARLAGFATVRNADGDAGTLAEATARWTTPEWGPLLHVCGAEADGKLAAALAAKNFTLRKSILYAVDAAAALPAAIAQVLQAGAVDAALFFSPRSARIFCDLAADLPLAPVIAIAISPTTAAALACRSWGEIRIAAAPNQDALLTLLAK